MYLGVVSKHEQGFWLHFDQYWNTTIIVIISEECQVWCFFKSCVDLQGSGPDDAPRTPLNPAVASKNVLSPLYALHSFFRHEHAPTGNIHKKRKYPYKSIPQRLALYYTDQWIAFTWEGIASNIIFPWKFCFLSLLAFLFFSWTFQILIFRITGEYTWEVQGNRSLPDPIPLVPHGTQFGRHPHWTKTGEKEQRWLPSHWQSRQDARDIPVARRIERSQTTPIRSVGGRPRDG